MVTVTLQLFQAWQSLKVLQIKAERCDAQNISLLAKH